ncbi:sporulation/spore germination protein [Sphaerospermopsis aphanizomenoides BCCUSP55]|uniref:sporulation/spore germination protein n=1 Tax=Sphaerospermopsis aphanizomenoides TaxID=459663 RepID=UPI0019085746|nr:sporulation/spore germination protein [Sphaerospermopsis aphanizomenoides]MBK1986524.1 sporulation/spore germination protein [Sphaerospermopsis aphanizomenoides BCCUSP55]
MNLKKYIFSLVLLAVCTSISSCNSSDTSNNTTSAPTPNSTVSPTPLNSPIASQPFSTQPSPTDQPPTSGSKAVSGKTTNVTLYTSDAQCQNYVSQQTSVSADEPINEAVGKVLQQRETADFSLVGYRVNVNNGVAIIDLRIAPESKRQMASLSSCEQFALFGSLRKTLTSNAQWNIKEVRFTEKGEQIAL